MPSQFQLRGHSMESLRWQLFEKYGSRARIVRAESIQTGGLFGIGATTSFEVTVELDSKPALVRGAVGQGRAMAYSEPPRRRSATPRRGISALLAHADEADDARPAKIILPPVPAREIATVEAKADFDAILGELAGVAEEETNLASSDITRNVPRLSQRPGDLIILAGLREQPLHTAWSMMSSLHGGAVVLTAGDHRSIGVSHVFLDSVEVAKAQAVAASGGRSVLVAFSFGQRGSANLSVLGSVRANQLWLVVDAAHKSEDTQTWVRKACRYAVPDALAVVGANDTATPQTVNELRLPIGWVDGYEATSAEL